VIAGCGEASGPAGRLPDTGLVFLDLRSGATVASLSMGSDAVAVTLSDDGATAYLADSAPGDVYAVDVAKRSVKWRAHVGGAPFGMLVHDGRLVVSLYTASAVDELDLTNGKVVANHPVGTGPAALAVDGKGRVIVAGTRGEVDYLDGTPPLPAGHGFGVAEVSGQVWTADYERAELYRAGDLKIAGMPEPLFPFWLAPAAGGKLLVAAEGDPEDTSAGGVFLFDPVTGSFVTLAHPRDPDLVLQSAGTVFVAAHGDSEVLAINGGKTSTWARGAAAVALAADPKLNLLVVAVNAHE
jgi:DNA-binding beta-propeller fold protein YncE